MNYKRSIFMALLLIVSGVSELLAQNAIPATGGNASGSKGSVSYSVGQLVYTTNTGTNGSVAQGVQQPFEIMQLSSIAEAKGINLSCVAYPNPAKELLNLRVEVSNKLNIRNLTYLLFDINGKFLKSEKLDGNETVIEMSNYMPATYILKVVQGSKEIKTFKIIKN